MFEFSFANNTNTFDEYDRESPVACWKLNLIAFYFLILFAASFLVNSVLLWIFVKEKEFRTPLNAFVIAFTALSVLGSVVQGPFVIASNFYCR